jgi:hypothetical protein
MQILKTMKSFHILILLSFLFVACSKKTSIPTATTSQKVESPTKPINTVVPSLRSNIIINYKVNKKSIIDTFNYVFDDFAKLPLIFPEYDATIKIKRSGSAKIDMVGKEIKMIIPMNVDVLKKTMIKDFKANGTLEMSINTTIDIDKLWGLTTKTELVNHTWLKKPTIDLGAINFPIETISNIIIDKSRTEVVKSIDQSIKQTYNLKSIIQDIASKSLTPYKLNDVFGGWMQMESDSAFFLPVKNTPQYIAGKIQLITKMNVSTTPPVYKKITPPSFNWKETINDSSQLSLPMELEYDYLTKILQDNFVGQIFKEGDKAIEILDAKVDKKDGKLQITITTKGDFNGQLSLLGIPAFNKSTSLLFIEDLDVKVKTGNVLYQAAAWLIKGKIKSKFNEMTQFSIKDNMTNLQTQVDAQAALLSKQYSIKMKIVTGIPELQNVILRPDRLNLNVGIKFKMDTDLENLGIFRE